MKKLGKVLLCSMFLPFMPFLSGCDEDEPKVEPEEEVIASVVLTFSPVTGGNPITAVAMDHDGEGAGDLETLGDVPLHASTDYVLHIDLLGVEGEDIGEEVAGEDEEHMLFFKFSDDLFTSPDGDGNVDSRDDDVNYQDFDDNNYPLGLSTQWSTISGTASGDFRVVLKHQPGIKSESSTYNDGATDVDVTFTVNIE